ncbi:16S rRNA (cytidine(1402)-2'-O)-methyltransferase [Longimicrobium terrae]|uniref:Ribosomal RNA small subunit methyltransferase I n=1 Tax=Longimicrobium terrae TaxID=1639882 RepID=A0A841GVB3_9BACT|nr:16S rRNA (cytidine(1402)-2'-O)-methyltransferase [Longimicrobium terrae]MBB4635194.1 16S rRNA (cytidine1402-2'-O)-methyltransferase [Longimicrobium terrae]MBB6069588.1 16S rRNA (cytidine1402-2'-O)-methyltransferase [Longimicrobium terrae]NNC31610.1 16S rRNA (cytidine(1402)-2'-O)-methyltransferase [Longimicrobium terrae]
MTSPSLHIVSTPIGNLGDISRRAVDTLRDADVVLAEDTRRTGMLLRHLEIQTRLMSAHEHNEASRATLVVEMLREGKNVALVSDAGTPLLSDPGARIVREVVAAGFPVIPIPGASALLSALVASGIEAERFTFFGFPPRKGPERTELLEEVAASPRASVLYESPNRLGRLMVDLAEAAGGERRVAVARELTKMHEEFFRGTLTEAAARYADAEVLGEIVVVVAGRTADAVAEGEVDELAADAVAKALLSQGQSPSAVAKELRRRLGISRNDAYRIAQDAAEP